MTRNIKILVMILMVQIGLTVAFFMNKKDTGAFISTEPLLAIKRTSVDKITIEDKDNSSLIIKKAAGNWILPDYYGFPASPAKIKQFTKKLFGLKRGWAVATTQAAAGQLKVADSNFERKISFSKTGEPLKTLLIGSSPGFRKVHARVSGQDEIYAIEFSSYEASVKPQDWIDKNILRVKRGNITQIEMPSFTLRREGEKFVVRDAGKDEEPVDSEINTLVSSIINLSFQDVLGIQDKPEYQQASPALVYTLHMNSGDKVKYTFSKPKDEDYLVLKTSSRDYYFKLNKYSVERIQKVTREKLVQKRKKQSSNIKSAGK